MASKWEELKNKFTEWKRGAAERQMGMGGALA